MSLLDRIDSVRRTEQVTLGAMAFLAGADKFTNLFVEWTKYLSPSVVKLLPVSPTAFMDAVGVIEMGVGIAILTKWPKLGGYIACGWLAAVAINLAVGGFFDIAVRDLVIAVSAFALARLTGASEEAAGRERAQARPAFTD
jgi:hypothetical protein